MSFLKKVLIKDLYVFNDLFNQMKIKDIKSFNKSSLDTDKNGGLKIKFWDKENESYRTFLVSDKDFFDASYKLAPLSLEWKAFLYSKLGNTYLEYLGNTNGISSFFEKTKIINLSKDMKSAVIIVEEKFKDTFSKNDEFFSASVINFVHNKKQKNNSNEKTL